MEMTLEKELQSRILLHKIGITGGVLMQDYINSQLQGNIKLPKFQVEEMADAYSDTIIKQAMQNGTFNELYEKAWTKVCAIMPEHTRITD